MKKRKLIRYRYKVNRGISWRTWGLPLAKDSLDNRLVIYFLCFRVLVSWERRRIKSELPHPIIDSTVAITTNLDSSVNNNDRYELRVVKRGENQTR